MIELLAIGSGVVLAAAVAGDYIADGIPDLLNRLERRLGARVQLASPAKPWTGPALDDWLRRHAGTTDIDPEDRRMFAEHLRQATEEIR